MCEQFVLHLNVVLVKKNPMSSQLPAPAASNSFERIKRVNADGQESWSARDLARVLEYTDFRNFIAVISKAREACANSDHAVSDHFVESNEMVSIGSGAQRTIEDWALCCVAGTPHRSG
jgi:DNA-damage-inducible protein D